ncbi:Diaminopimelate decarboxylase [Legionella pneumophila]|uniref:hypothetical protein n=2 Tax=Legionella pneumophila TaxID=446 RepID=UPI0005CB31EA|nr:hypothetical protein [Legionella pneumophila]HAT8816422.1 hypothetical protein [Legionella pneumophila subsp. pneumophila]MCZ4805701.1 hypothetical protein [Legionella pneumophila]MDW9180253.1 hypothetical protein [Legionella pneumophila]WAI78155.1 hypothetical protein OXA86_09795 [Legionella pneumophila]CZH27651.1 Diaminopimelate decarboxylase [Legionella pneumophila]
MNQMNWRFLENISEVVTSPFYILNETCLVDNYKNLLSAFKKHYSNTLVAYACKANNCESVLKALSGAGALIEVSSSLEYQGIINLDHDPEKIIFNGPLKTENDWLLIQKNSSIANIDSIDEMEQLYRIAGLHSNKDFRVGLRLRLPTSRFGIPVDVHTFNSFKDSLRNYPNIQYVSLHGHSNCKTGSLTHFANLTKLLLKTAEEYFPDTIQSINLGGGILHPEIPAGSVNEPIPSWHDYAFQISNLINESRWAHETQPMLYLEPGAGLVANAVQMVTKVIKTEKSGNNYRVTVDANALQVKPTRHKLNMPLELVKSQQDAEYHSGCFTVYGPTCWEDDILLSNVSAEIPRKGDYLIINHVGAYTISLMPHFIMAAPAVISLEDNTFKILHPRQTLLHPTSHL